ncbi:GntR family transcriptional regulator [Streptomyces sp. SPB074]|nr:GntR family transcriptional regulator [Streptomyces sp. SPB074]
MGHSGPRPASRHRPRRPARHRAGPAHGRAARGGTERAARARHPAALLAPARRRPRPRPGHRLRRLRGADRRGLAHRPAGLGHPRRGPHRARTEGAAPSAAPRRAAPARPALRQPRPHGLPARAVAQGRPPGHRPGPGERLRLARHRHRGAAHGPRGVPAARPGRARGPRPRPRHGRIFFLACGSCCRGCASAASASSPSSPILRGCTTRSCASVVWMRVVVLPFDDDGTVPLPPPGTHAVLLTPSHQFPTGGALLPARRTALVDWARAHDGLILEDDYDGEFRYDRQPVGALQGLDPERVVHLGTTSKSLATGLRLGWAVLPAALATGSLAPHGGWGGTTWGPGAMDQLTFAVFLRSGAYDRHVRAMRLRYRRRRDALVAAVTARAPGVGVSGIAAGLHAVLRLPPGTEPVVLRAAAWERLALTGLARFRHPDAVLPPADALVVGYATPADHAWPSALEALCRVLP